MLDSFEVKESVLEMLGNLNTADLMQLQSIRELTKFIDVVNQIKKAYYHKKDVLFATFGDSTRSMLQSEWGKYYPQQLEKLGLTYFQNAYPSQTAHNWQNNIGNATIQQLIDASLGEDGEDTIVECSIGLNDFTQLGGKAEAKDSIKNAILKYQLAKPKAVIFLVSPNYAGNEARRIALKEIYEELSIELNLPLVDGHIPTIDLNLSLDYYYDTTHMNPFGCLRLRNYILEQIVPFELKQLLEFTEYDLPSNLGELSTQEVRNGLYNSIGTFDVSPNYRSIAPYPVKEGYIIQVSHNGNRNRTVFFDKNGDLINRVSRTPKGLILVPKGAIEARTNISTSGSEWDALNETPSVKYYQNEPRNFIPMIEINKGLNLQIKTNRFKDDRLIDYYGSNGAIGESLKIDSEGKSKWS